VFVVAGWSSTGCHCIFKTFHRCFVNIYRYGFKSPARNGDLKSMSFVLNVTSILVNDSFFFCSSFFCFNNTNTSVRSFIFFLLTTLLYIQKGPLSKFQPGTPHNLNPPLHGPSFLKVCDWPLCYVDISWTTSRNLHIGQWTFYQRLVELSVDRWTAWTPLEITVII